MAMWTSIGCMSPRPGKARVAATIQLRSCDAKLRITRSSTIDLLPPTLDPKMWVLCLGAVARGGTHRAISKRGSLAFLALYVGKDSMFKFWTTRNCLTSTPTCQVSLQKVFKVPYDYNSVMHYSPTLAMKSLPMVNGQAGVVSEELHGFLK